MLLKTLRATVRSLGRNRLEPYLQPVYTNALACARIFHEDCLQPHPTPKGPKMAKFTEAEKQQALDMFKAGHTAKEVAEATGASQATLANWKRDAGLTSAKGAPTRPRRAAVKPGAVKAPKPMTAQEVASMDKLERYQTIIQYLEAQKELQQQIEILEAESREVAEMLKLLEEEPTPSKGRKRGS